MEETMKDYEKELEASFRKIREGDVISGTVIDVNEEEVTLDLKYYTQGIIKAEDMSNDPAFSLLKQRSFVWMMDRAIFFFQKRKLMKYFPGTF